MSNSSTFLFSTMFNSLTFLFSTMFNSLTFSLLNMSNVSTFSKLDLAQRSDFSKDVKISRKMEDDDLWCWRRVHYKITAANAQVIIHQERKEQFQQGPCNKFYLFEKSYLKQVCKLQKCLSICFRALWLNLIP